MKVKKYVGRKILRRMEYENRVIEKTYNTIDTFENEKKSIYNEYSELTLLEDKIELYKCMRVNVNGNLGRLYELRKRIKEGRYRYEIYLTKEEIKELLDEDYVVVIEGMGEVDKEDLEKI